MESLKLRKVGDALVVTIPDSIVAGLNLKEGDSLSVDQEQGIMTLTPELSMEEASSAKRMMHRYDEVLKRLAR